jgi:hypothetical protein
LGRGATHERNEMLKLAIERVEAKGTGRLKQVAISWTGWLEQAAAVWVMCGAELIRGL